MPLHDNFHDNAHFNAAEQKAKNLKIIFENLIHTLVNEVAKEQMANPDGFSFENNKRIKKLSDMLFNNTASKIVVELNAQTKDSMQRGVNKFAAYLAKNTKLPQETIKKARSINLDAVNAFQKRKAAGMTLSDRVWKITDSFKDEMESALDLALSQGKSAQDIAREVRYLLNNPTARVRRVRDERGNLKLTKEFQGKFGKGVYGSAYRNALRLARTENNIAYHTATNLKYQEFDFVVGIEIKLSNNPNHCPMCEGFAGKYPKDFKFTSWHPQCRCTSIPILKTEEEMEANDLKIAKGGNVMTSSKNKVYETPKAFQDYIRQHGEKFKTAKSVPYFVRDNKKYVVFKKDIAIGKIDSLAKGKIFDDAKLIDSIFEKSERSWSEVIETFEKNNSNGRLEYINIKDIKITQPNIQSEKVKKMLENPDDLPVINVVKFNDGTMAIFDGHHRLSASWALGETKIKVNLVEEKALKLNPFADDAYHPDRKMKAVWGRDGNAHTIDDLLRKKAGEVWREASQEERESIYAYTGSGYMRMNSAARRGDISNYEVRHATSIIEKSFYDFDIWSQRGVNIDSLNFMFGIDNDTVRSIIRGQAGNLDLNSFVGKTGYEKGFISTAAAKGRGFADETVIFNIYSPKGTKGIYAEPFSAHGNGKRLNWDGLEKQTTFSSEFEFLLQRNTEFRITKFEYNEQNRKFYIDLEVISQNP